MDGKYFTITKKENTKIEALCNVPTCNKVRRGDVTSTGNFMDHIRKSHPELVAEVELYRKQNSNADGNDERNENTRKHQKTIHQMFKKFTTEEVCFCLEKYYFENYFANYDYLWLLFIDS